MKSRLAVFIWIVILTAVTLSLAYGGDVDADKTKLLALRERLEKGAN